MTNTPQPCGQTVTKGDEMTTIDRPNRPCSECKTPHNNPTHRCTPCETTANKTHNQAREYYHTTQWANLRAWIVQRDYHQCAVCNRRTTLHVHHIQARKDGGPDTPTNLVTLCATCHNHAEREHRDTLDAITTYMQILKAQP